MVLFGCVFGCGLSSCFWFFLSSLVYERDVKGLILFFDEERIKKLSIFFLLVLVGVVKKV